MEEVVVVGIDLAKSVFQVHGVDTQGKVVLRQRLNQAKVLPFFAKLPSCLIGMETCASANHWARELIALGHEARLMPGGKERLGGITKAGDTYLRRMLFVGAMAVIRYAEGTATFSITLPSSAVTLTRA